MTSTKPPSRNLAAIVTGSARGIGKVIAIKLAEDGYDVALNDLSSRLEELEAVATRIQEIGRKALIVPADVTDEQAIDTLVARTVAELGDLYVMVANAGIGSPSAPVVDLSLDLWNRFLSINLTGVFLCYRAAARQMIKQGKGGRIVGASSSYGKRGVPHAAAYCTTKFGVRGLTQSLASEVGKHGITVNAYAPGFIDTPMLDDVANATAAGLQTEEEKESIKKSVKAEMAATSLTGKMGTPENVAALVSYLVSDQADFMTGQSVALNGGWFYD
ncbi:hypothetical protein M422DRAFT_24853 [Sphaerobolus stellatus SS14]|nr:hypothetical protein M422DRAFT_24853 [Sphaerobolus stellatus SS14]